MTSSAPSPSSHLVDIRELRLGDARALLGHSGAADLPDPTLAPLAYFQGLIDGLCNLSLKDPLTGLANRRHFNAVLEREIAVVARSGESTLLLMLDIDHFKKVNDTYGHPAGDRVLQVVAKCLGDCVRPKDTVVRYGGEEFAVILPDCQVSFGRVVAERMRKMIESLSINVAPTVDIKVTISIGGAYAPEWVRSTAAIWTERADAELYRAKTSGRNRVCIDQQEVMAVSAEEKNLLFGHLAQDNPAWIESAPADASLSAMSAINAMSSTPGNAGNASGGTFGNTFGSAAQRLNS